MRVCGVLFSNDLGGVPADDTGCRLQVGHDGPHEFIDASGKAWQWETDWECDCDHCREDDGDYCTIYWPKKPAAASKPN